MLVINFVSSTLSGEVMVANNYLFVFLMEIIAFPTRKVIDSTI